jgi:hypothetical protein
MVIRLVAVPDSSDVPDFDDIFHAVLGWDSGISFAFQIWVKSLIQRKIRSKKLRHFRLHRHQSCLGLSPPLRADQCSLADPWLVSLR